MGERPEREFRNNHTHKGLVSAETTNIPHSQGPEKSVVSTLLKHPEKMDDAAHLTEDHFHMPTTRGIFSAIMRTRARGEEVELVSFIQRLHEAGELDDLGGPSAISDIFTYAPNTAHFAQHTKMLTEALTLRRAQKLASEIELAVAEGGTPEAVAELVATRSTALTDTLTEAKPASDTRALLRLAAQRWEDLATGKSDPAGMQTSLARINQAFRGLKPNRVTVISALPSHGKTLLGGQLFMDCVSEGHKGLFLTWEMSEDELIDRFLAYAARKPINAVTDPLRYAQECWGNEKPSESDRLAMATSFRKVATMPLHVQAMHGQNISQAVAAIRREHRKSPLKIVVLDFIQRIPSAPGMEKQSYERQLCDIADRFQNLSQELGFHGIVLSQLNKEGNAKHAEAINESCALHLKIVKVPETDRDGKPVIGDGGKVKIKTRGVGIMKDRFHGQTGQLLPIDMNEENQRFEEYNQ